MADTVVSHSLFDAATVEPVGDGPWTQGYDVEVVRCAATLTAVDVCAPNSASLVAGSTTASGGTAPVYRIRSFAAEISAKRPTYCSDPEAAQIIADLLEEQSERVAAYVLWNGIGGVNGWGAANAYLLNSDVNVATAAANLTDTIGAAYAKYAGGIVNFDESILHLGLTAALEASALNMLTEGGRVKATGGKYVISESYPTGGIAITGPIKIKMGSTEALQAYNIQVNRTEVQGNRLMAVEFEPCISVRVG